MLAPIRGGTTQAGDITLSPVPIVVTTTSLASGFVGRPYHETLSATGAIGTVTWSLNAGSNPLPNGLAMGIDGVIGGTPTTYGTAPAFTVLRHRLARADRHRRALDFCRRQPADRHRPLERGLTWRTSTSSCRRSVSHGGAVATVTSGSLPPGMTFVAAQGLLSGPPTKIGTYTFTITLVDCMPAATCDPATVQQTVSQTFTLRVSARDQQTGGQAGTPISFGGPGGRKVAQVVTVGAHGTLNAFGFQTLACPAFGPVTVDVNG